MLPVLIQCVMQVRAILQASRVEVPENMEITTARRLLINTQATPILANVKLARKGKRHAEKIITTLVNRVPRENTRTRSPVGRQGHAKRVPLEDIIPEQVVPEDVLDVDSEKYPRPVKAVARVAQLASFNRMIMVVFVRNAQRAKLRHWDQRFALLRYAWWINSWLIISATIVRRVQHDQRATMRPVLIPIVLQEHV